MADKITMTSPRGIAVYPRLNSPDTKFDDLGSYKSDLRIATDAAQPFLEKLHKVFKSWTGKNHPRNPERDNKNALYYVERDEDDNETGFVVIKFRVKNKMTKKGELWDRRPAQFDAKGKPITNPKSVGGGTELIVSFEVYQWQSPTGGKGISLQPEAVQILKLVEFNSQKDASAYGFAAQDDGYSDEDDDGPFGDTTDDDDNDSVPADEDDDY